MSDLAMPHPGLASPPAARISQPSWRDSRLVAGVVLVLGSVVAGSHVVSSADTTTPVVALASDLPAGHVLTAADLSRVDVKLTGATAANYWRGTDAEQLVGHRLLRSGSATDLLTRGAVDLDAAPPMREVPVVVDPARLPVLDDNALVDVFVTYKSADGVKAPEVTQLLSGVELVDVPDDGMDGASKVRVLLHVRPDQVRDLIKASEVGELDVVEHLGGADAPVPSSAAGTATGAGAQR